MINNKYKDTQGILENAKINVFNNIESWKAFLITAAYSYKYNPVQQLLIHSQRPDATYCASFDLWNSLGRRIKSGSKGIAIFNESKLTHVFDIGDTFRVKPGSDYVWKADIENIKDFETKFQQFLAETGNDISNQIAEECLENSATKSYTINEIEDIRLFIAASIKKTASFRITGNPEFTALKSVNPTTLSLFQKDPDLRDFAFEVINDYTRGIIEKYKIEEKNFKKTLEKDLDLRNNSITEEIERGEAYGNNIQRNSGRNPASEPDTTKVETAEQVGRRETSLSQDNETKGIPKAEFKRDSERPLPFHRGPSRENGEQSHALPEREDGLRETASPGLAQRSSTGIPNQGRGGRENQSRTYQPIENETTEYNETKSAVQEDGTFSLSCKNFVISSDTLGVGKPEERYNNNVLAIKTLKSIEKLERPATEEEKEVLSKYVGWGGLSDKIQSKENELKQILTPEELKSAKQSTLTAFYTQPAIIKAIYQALVNMGLSNNARILEPSCGIGNFIGVLKDSDSKTITGVEIDSISGRIAKLLYPNSDIKINGFENTNLKDNYYDVAVGNVPFGNFTIYDKTYPNDSYKIHDYFFKKSLDKVHEGGIIAFITSSGTLDKKDSKFREEISKQANFLGAIRLPNNAFKEAAGTTVTTDIIFLQKSTDYEHNNKEWIELDFDSRDHCINKYYVNHPEMILGEIHNDWRGTVCEIPYYERDSYNLSEKLQSAINNIKGQIKESFIEEESEEITLYNNVPLHKYTLVDDNTIVIRKENEDEVIDIKDKDFNKLKSLIELRDTLDNLIKSQAEDVPDEELMPLRASLNETYEQYVAKFGRLCDKKMEQALAKDDKGPLLLSLEDTENGKFVSKSAIFTSRTVRPYKHITHTESSEEAYIVSLQDKGFVDIKYMESLTEKSENELFADLKGKIFLNPEYENNPYANKYLPNDEYLSGDIKEKINEAKLAALNNEEYNYNIEQLELVMPKRLTSEEIDARLGSTWIPPIYIEKFIKDLLQPSSWEERNLDVLYNDKDLSGKNNGWKINGVPKYIDNTYVTSTYGTSRINAYKIIEELLNLKTIKIYDPDQDDENRKILNVRETQIAQGKADIIKEKFKDWIWEDPIRRNELEDIYNNKFNTITPRKYDGSFIRFEGMSPLINLRDHQKNAVARIVYGGNTLLGHVVGAGKSFTMISAAQELKRLSLSNKSMFILPKSTIKQFENEYLTLYPNANILVANENDFKKENRKAFCSRIATGNYDSILLSYEQFEKIPLSKEKQLEYYEEKKQELAYAKVEAKKSYGATSRFTVKQLEKTEKDIEKQLKKLNDIQQDNTITFEELGIDRLFVDEAHNFKNLQTVTKMQNIGGINTNGAKKTEDLNSKIRYLNNLYNEKAVIFATGTPISNSMVELYTMQKYLQPSLLEKMEISEFDSWASTFGETITAPELAVEGGKFKTRTRFSKFFNLPELVTIFKEVADIQTSDMLNLKVPELERHNILLKPTATQKEFIAKLGERADLVHEGNVPPTKDNMLKITNDGRLIALDQRIINPLAEDDPGSKANVCTNNVFKIWEDTKEEKSTQIIFCDQSVPNNENKFSIYKDIKEKLIAKGIPENEIAFIHDYKTNQKRKALYEKINSGDIRVVFGSTQKLGTGTNIQEKLLALHHLDCAYRPSDMEQREGRIIRQGNTNKKVHIYTYLTEETFDSYQYQMLERKQRFVAQIMTSKSPARTAEDIDEAALNYGEIKALTAGDRRIKELLELEVDVAKLKIERSAYRQEIFTLQDSIKKSLPQRIKEAERNIENLTKDLEYIKENTKENEKGFSPLIIKGNTFTDKTEAGEELLNEIKTIGASVEPKDIGEYRGLKLQLCLSDLSKAPDIILVSPNMTYRIEASENILGNIIKMDNVIEKIGNRIQILQENAENLRNQIEIAKLQIDKPFVKEEEYQKKNQRLKEIKTCLDIGNQEFNLDNQEENEKSPDASENTVVEIEEEEEEFEV